MHGHGGHRTGAGRKPIPTRVRTKSVPISLLPKHVADAKIMGNGVLASGVQRAVKYTLAQIEKSGLKVETFFSAMPQRIEESSDEQGKQRKSVGRPKLPTRERMKAVGVSLRPSQVEDAKGIGRGRLARGIRRAIEFTQTQKEESGLGVEAFFKDAL